MKTAPHYDYIDGLRGLAIVAVVAYHLDALVLPGGYSGVDVFFVISGLVVATALHRQRAPTLGATLSGFYLRRLRRILPALLTMLIFTHLAAVLVMPQAHLSNAIASTGFAAFWGVSNFVLAGKADYFTPLAHHNPFTHTWSLAVEEQFYLLFPLLLYAITRKQGITWRSFAAVAALCLLSLAYGGFETLSGTGMGFYSSLGRFWEIGAGVLLFLYFQLRQESGPERSWLVWLGGGAIAVSLLLPAGGAMPVPGALLPVAGTVLVILGLHQRDIRSLPGLLLSSGPAIWIGVLSYSLYLWHWPVFVLARWTWGFSSLADKLAAVAVATILSVASYVLIEQPFRRSVRLGTAVKAIPAMLALAVASHGAALTMRAVGPSISLSPATRAPDLWYPYEPLADASGCRGRKTASDEGDVERTEIVNDCGGKAGDATIHVLGDSHAGAYIRMLDEVARREGVRVVIREVRGCGVAVLAAPAEPCIRAASRAIADAAAAIKPGDIVFLPGLRVPRRYEQSFDSVQDAQGIMAQWATASDEALQRVSLELAPLLHANVPIIFELPKPVLDAPVYRCAAWFNAGNEACRGGLATPREAMEKLRAPVVTIAKRIAAKFPQVATWDPLPVLCPYASCPAFAGGVPLYFDADHLSGAGSALLADSFISVLASLHPPSR